jgi:hypothetical protein
MTADNFHKTWLVKKLFYRIKSLHTEKKNKMKYAKDMHNNILKLKSVNTWVVETKSSIKRRKMEEMAWV